MKKLFSLLFILAALPLFAEEKDGILDRFNEPGKPRTTFISKGNWAVGISGSYRSFSAGGEKSGDGFSVLSMLNIGDGSLKMYEATPSFSYFVADDLSLGLRLEYSGYSVDTDLRLDLRDVIKMDYEEDEELGQMMGELLNVQISGRHMVRNAWGGSLAVRKYLSFFGSKTFAVFGEGRLYGNFGLLDSCPIDKNGMYVESKTRNTKAISAGLKFAGGLCVKLRDNSALTVSVPIIGAAYQYTKQHKQNTGNTAHLSSFNISRDLDYIAVQVGYVHYIAPKKR